MIPAPTGGRRGSTSLRLLAAAAVAATVLSTSCVASGTAVSTPFATTRPVLEHGPIYEVKVAPVGGLGPVLVDGQGLTLYLYGTDHRGAPSRCSGICAIQWPPLTLPAGVAAPVTGPGIEPRLLGTAPRADGTTQITYNGWPLYLWPPDRTPGQATGQALSNAGGRWYVLDVAGNAVTTP